MMQPEIRPAQRLLRLHGFTSRAYLVMQIRIVYYHDINISDGPVIGPLEVHQDPSWHVWIEFCIFEQATRIDIGLVTLVQIKIAKFKFGRVGISVVLSGVLGLFYLIPSSQY